MSIKEQIDLEQRKKGVVRTQRESARKLLREGKSMLDVSHITGLTPETVGRISAKLKEENRRAEMLKQEALISDEQAGRRQETAAENQQSASSSAIDAAKEASAPQPVEPFLPVYIDTDRLITAGDRVRINLPTDGYDPSQEEYDPALDPYLAHIGRVDRLADRMVWVKDNGREFGVAPELLELLGEEIPVSTPLVSDLPSLEEMAEDGRQFDTTPAPDKPASAWNSHICDDMPREYRVLRDEDGDPSIITDSYRVIGPINFCPWCAVQLIG
jgi:hypothetical protein